jgi:hypothetical protein
MRRYSVLPNGLIVTDTLAAVAQGLYGPTLTDELVAQANATRELYEALDSLLAWCHDNVAYFAEVPGRSGFEEAKRAANALKLARGRT